jgi:hypothetical protein
MGSNLVTIDLSDPKFNTAARGGEEEAAPAAAPRVKREISPEMEKFTQEMSPLRAWARAAASKYSFGKSDWLASKMFGGQDEQEMSARIRELNPKASVAGDMTGGALQGMQASGALGMAAPVLLGGAAAATGTSAALNSVAANTLRAGLLREGLSSFGLGAADQAIHGKFDPNALALQTGIGMVTGGVGSQLPALWGNAKTIASKIMPRPLEEAEKRVVGQAGQFGEHYGFQGPAALTTAQKMRLSEAPDLQQAAANAERITNRAGVAAREPQRQAFAANRLDKMMEDSVPQPGSPNGPSQGGLRDYPAMSGKQVGQSHHAFPDTTVFNPPRPLPPSAQAGLDDSFARDAAMWATQMANKGTPRPQPQPNEFKHWEDILNRNKSRYPMHRDDVAATRDIFADVNPILRNRMHAEQRAEDVSRIKGVVENAPATPDRIPDSIPLSLSVLPNFLRHVPLLNRLPNASASIPIPMPKPTGRYQRADAILNDPSFLDMIGRMTAAQGATGGALAGAATGPARR